MAFSFRLPDNLRSTDFKVFEALYKIMFGAIKKNINEITDLKDINRCPDYMLPELASSVGCPYLTGTSPYANRQLIKYWWITIRSKGTESAIRTMAALGLLCYDSINTYVNDIVVYNRTIDVVYDKNTGSIYLQVTYQGSDDNKDAQEAWMRELIEYVRPAGFNTTFQPAEFANPYLNVKVQLATGIDSRQYSTDVFSTIIPNVTEVGDEAPLCFGTYDTNKINYIDNSNLMKLTINDPVITNLTEFTSVTQTFSNNTITFTLPTDTNAATFIDNTKIYPQIPVYIDVTYTNNAETSTAHLIANRYTSGTSIITDLSNNEEINDSEIDYTDGSVIIPFIATSITAVKVKYAKASMPNVLVEPSDGSTFDIDTARLKLSTTDISGYYIYNGEGIYAPITFNAIIKKYSGSTWSAVTTISNLTYSQVVDLVLSSTQNDIDKLAVYINLVPTIIQDGQTYYLDINYYNNILIKYLNTLTIMKSDNHLLKCDGATYSNSSIVFDCPYRDKCMRYSNSFLTETVTSVSDNHKITVPNIDVTKKYKYCRVWHNSSGTVINTLYYLDYTEQTSTYVYTNDELTNGAVATGDKIILYTEDITDYGIGMSEIATISKFTLTTNGKRTLNSDITDNRFDIYPKLTKCSMSNVSRIINSSGNITESSNLIDVGTTITVPTDDSVYWYVFTLTADSGSTLPSNLPSGTIMIQDMAYDTSSHTFSDIDISGFVDYNNSDGTVKFGVASQDDTANHIIKLSGNIYINLTLT